MLVKVAQIVFLFLFLAHAVFDAEKIYSMIYIGLGDAMKCVRSYLLLQYT